MLAATKPLAAAHTPSHGSSSLTSTVSSGRWVSRVPRRGQSSSTRRTVSKISCKRVSLADAGNGEAGVLMIDPPKLTKTTVELKAIVTVHLKDKSKFENVSLLSGLLGKLMYKKWLFIELVSSELDPGEKLHFTS